MHVEIFTDRGSQNTLNEGGKKVQMNLFTKQESQMQKTNLWLSGDKGLGGGKINWEIAIDIHTLLYIKQITNKKLLYSTGNSTQYSVLAYMGKNLKKSGYMYMYN